MVLARRAPSERAHCGRTLSAIPRLLSQSKAFLLVACCGFTLSAQAAVVENVTIGNAKALAMANAVTADPPGIDSIHFNPAGLAKMKNRRYTFKFLLGAFDFTTEFGERGGAIDRCLDNNTGECFLSQSYQDPYENSTSSTKTPSLMLPVSGLTEMPIDAIAAPLGGFSYSPEGSNFTFGTNVYVPMGAGYKRGDDDPGRFFGKEFSLARITYFSPTVGYQVNEHWSVGFAALFSWQGVGVDMDLRIPNFATAGIDSLAGDLCASDNIVNSFLTACGGSLAPYDTVASLQSEMSDSFSFSWNLGVLWEPNEWFSWGMVYQAEGKTELKGEYALTYGVEWSNLFGGLLDETRGNATAIDAFALIESVGLLSLPRGNADLGADVERVETGTITSELNSPAHFATGVSLRVTPNVKVNFDVKWTDWGGWEEIRLDFDTDQIDFLKVAGLLPTQGLAGDTFLSLPRNYNSVWNWALGTEYTYSDRLLLRAGYENRASSIPNDKQDLLVPLGEADLFTFGASYLLKKGTVVEVAYAFLDSSDSVASGSSSNANSDDSADLIYNPYAGLAFENKTSAHIFVLNYNAPF